MSEKKLNARIVHKHDVESNWLKATNFIPKQGEIIVYDTTHFYFDSKYYIVTGEKDFSELFWLNKLKFIE